MKSISAAELKKLLTENSDLLLIDVREKNERTIFHIGGLHIPLGSIMNHVNAIPVERPVVFYCKKGIRSAWAIQRLQRKKSFENLYNLQGGLDAWH